MILARIRDIESTIGVQPVTNEYIDIFTHWLAHEDESLLHSLILRDQVACTALDE